MKEQDKTLEKELTKVDIRNIPDKEFKIMIIKMLNEHRRRMDKHDEKFSKELENMKRTKQI